jgi:hypothetical protein
MDVVRPTSFSSASRPWRRRLANALDDVAFGARRRTQMVPHARVATTVREVTGRSGDYA